MNDRPSSPTITSPILVTGGTGTLGRLVVARLRAAGAAVRVLGRGRHAPEERPSVEFVTADLATGAGVEAALRDVEVIVHCAGTRVGDDVKARNLVQAAARTRARHLVYITVVGDERVPLDSAIDRSMFGYFGSKLAAEQVIVDSGIPWSTLHATQFHESLLAVARQMAKLPVIPAPRGLLFQPIAAGEVAARLVELALGAPAGRVPELGGPRVYEMADLIRAYLGAAGKRRLVVRVPTAGAAARAIRGGAILPENGVEGRQTWEEFLAANLRAAPEHPSAAAL